MCFHVLSIVYGHSGILIHGVHSVVFSVDLFKPRVRQLNGLNGYNGWLTNTHQPKDRKSSPQKKHAGLLGTLWQILTNDLEFDWLRD